MAARADIPIVSVELMRASDAYTIEHFIDDAELMDRAGCGIASLCIEAFPGPYAVLCGPGNNGGDGYVVARYLTSRLTIADSTTSANTPTTATDFTATATSVSIFYTKEPTSDSSKHHAALLQNTNVAIAPFTPNTDLSHFGTIFDCLLGTGFSGTPRGLIADAICAINKAKAQGVRVISADINSGVNGDTGTASEHNCAVISDLTVSIGFLKTGMLNPGMHAYAEHITNIDIGIVLSEEPDVWLDRKSLPSWISASCVQTGYA